MMSPPPFPAPEQPTINQLSCPFHALFMPFSCPLHALFMPFPCPFHALFMRFSCPMFADSFHASFKFPVLEVGAGLEKGLKKAKKTGICELYTVYIFRTKTLLSLIVRINGRFACFVLDLNLILCHKIIEKNHYILKMASNKRAFSNAFKAEVVEEMEEKNLTAYATAKHFQKKYKIDLDPSMVQRWFKKRIKINTSPKHNKRINGGGRKPALGILEDLLTDEIIEMRANKLKVTRSYVSQRALQLAEEHESNSNFDASPSWVSRFLNRNGFSLRRMTNRETKADFTVDPTELEAAGQDDDIEDCDDDEGDNAILI